MSLKKCIPAIAAFLLAACGGDGNKAGDPDPSAEADFVVDTFGDLSVCTDKREGATAYVKDEDNAYICTNGGWTINTNADTRKKSSSSKDKAKSSSLRCEDCKDGANSNGSSGNQKTAWDYLNPNIDYDEMVDDRDGQVYKTVKIGDQVWMAENLNYEVDSSFCYNDSAEYCEKYGRLYKWAAAVGKSEEECGYGKKCGFSGKVRGVCPEGWRLPYSGEWNHLLSEVGGESNAGAILRSQTGWKDRVVVNGGDSYGFSALPAGERNKGGTFYKSDYAKFWSATEDDNRSAWFMYMRSLSASVSRFHDNNKEDAYSVRCLQDDLSSVQSSNSEIACKTETGDNCEYGELKDDRDGRTYKTVKIGDQVWMAENLNYKVDSSFCYNDSAEYCEKYGRLYQWVTAVGKSEEECGYGNYCRFSGMVRGVCPKGWHLPREEEWETLSTKVGGKSKTLKSQSGWNDSDGTSGNGTDDYGFSAFPAGSREPNGDFIENGIRTYFWNAEGNSDSGGRMLLTYSGESVYINTLPKGYALSVRCLQD